MDTATVQVRMDNLKIEADIAVGSRGNPTVTNTFRNMAEVSLLDQHAPDMQKHSAGRSYRSSVYHVWSLCHLPASSCEHYVVKTHLLLHITHAHRCCFCRSLLFKVHSRDTLPRAHAPLQCRLSCIRPCVTVKTEWWTYLHLIGCAEEDTSPEGHISALHYPRHNEQHPVSWQIHTAAGAPRGRQDDPAECPLWPPAQEPQYRRELFLPISLACVASCERVQVCAWITGSCTRSSVTMSYV